MTRKPRCLDFLGPHLGHAHPRVRYSAFQAMGQTAYDHDPYVAEILEGEIGEIGRGTVWFIDVCCVGPYAKKHQTTYSNSLSDAAI